MPWPNDFPTPASKLISAFRLDFIGIVEALLGTFMGAAEPPALYAGMIWSDTSSGYVKQRNAANTGWEILRKLGEDWGGMLARTGGGLTGPLDMNNNAIVNLPLGSGTAPARYADLAPYAKLDGSIAFTGIPSGPAQDPSSANQLARKAYVDAKAVAGGSFANQITLPAAAAVGSAQAVRQSELESMRDTHTHSGAVGAGTRIKLQDLITTGLAINKVALTPGDGGGPIFKDLKLSPIQIFADPPSVWSGASSFGSWDDVDLSPHFGQGSYAALLSVDIVGVNNGGTVTAFARKSGTTPTNPQKFFAAAGGIQTQRSFFLIEIDPSVRQLQVRVDPVSSTGHTVTYRLLAHVQQAAL